MSNNDFHSDTLVPWHPPHNVMISYDLNHEKAVMLNLSNRTVSVKSFGELGESISKHRNYLRCPTCHQILSSSMNINSNSHSQQDIPTYNGPQFRTTDYFQRLEETVEIKDDINYQSYNRFIPRGVFNPGYYKKFFIEEKRLGHGAFGSVFLCSHMLGSHRLGLFAVKKVPVGEDQQRFRFGLREVRALCRLQHPNIIPYKHCWLENDLIADFGPEVPCLFILMEYANEGNLADLLWPNKSQEKIQECTYRTE